jgi:hypothetical protein
MRVIRGFEIAAGALAVISGVAIMGSIWQGGFIDPNSVVPDLLAYGMMLLLVALGVTLDVLTMSGPAKAVALLMLVLGALTLTGWFAISFILEFGLPALLAIIATVLGFVGLPSRGAAAQATR